jgi:DNA-binding NarL/FixJ family response regulator
MHAPTVLILHGNPFFAQSLHQRILAIHPAATLLVTARVKEAASLLAAMRVDMFLAGLEAVDGDVLDLLLHRSRARRSVGRTLVLMGRHGARALVTLCRLGIDGAFDLLEEPPQKIAEAVAAVEAGRGYWSPAFSAALMSNEMRVVMHQLSPAEQLALALMGDGCSDKVAAERLGMSSHAVRSLRRDLHAKLDVHDKQGLQRIAARLSFTRFSEEGVVPMGAAILLCEYVERSKRPVSLPEETLEKWDLVREGDALLSSSQLTKSG